MCKNRPAPRCEDHSSSSYVSARIAESRCEEGSPAQKYAEKRRDRWSRDLRLSLGGRLANGESAEEAANQAESRLQAQLMETAELSEREALTTARAVIGDFRSNPESYKAEWQARTAKASRSTSFMRAGEDFTDAPRLSSIRVPVEEVDASKTTLAARREFAASTDDKEAINRGIKGEPAGSVLESLASNENLSSEQLRALWVRAHTEKDLAQQTGRLTTAIRNNPAWNADAENRAVVATDTLEEKKKSDVAKRLASGGAKGARAALRIAEEEARTADDFNVLNNLSRQGKRTVSLAVLGNKAVTAPIVQRLSQDPDTKVKAAAHKHPLYDNTDELERKREQARTWKRESRARAKLEAAAV